MPPKSKKKAMTSKFEFWNDLPVEMRMECIKRMDFKTRMQLRATSKQDKLLVESAPKHHFNGVNLQILNSEWLKTIYFDPHYVSATEKTHHLAAQVIKFSTATTLSVSACCTNFNNVSKFLADNSNLATYKFQKLTINSNWFEVVEFFLKNNNNNVESISLFFPSRFESDKMLEFVAYPSVINAGIVSMLCLDNVEIPYQLIMKWLEKDDLEVGKKIRFERPAVETIDDLYERLASSKILDISDKCVLISTNNPTKAIRIRLDTEYTLAITISVVEFNRNEQRRDSLNLGALGAALPNL